MSYLENRFPLYDASDFVTVNQLKKCEGGDNSGEDNPSTPSQGLTEEQVQEMIQDALESFKLQLYSLNLSDEETVVGTYFGKPMYGRCFNGIATELNTYSVIAHIELLDTVVFMYGDILNSFHASDGIRDFASNKKMYIDWNMSGDITVFVEDSYYLNMPINMVCFYTKTTD